MVSSIYKLSKTRFQKIANPGWYSDGGGLYFRVTKRGSKQWIYRFTYAGRRREMGLGGFPKVTLDEAREFAKIARADVSSGKDPIVERQLSKSRTFGEVADEYIARKKLEWRTAKREQIWKKALVEQCMPIRDIPINQITTDHVMLVLTPVWLRTPSMGKRLRGRIENVLGYATSFGWRSGPNPATWKGHLEHLLPKHKKTQKNHHKAMPYQDVPDFIALLRKRPEIQAMALEFTILTAARTGEVLKATWSEIDFESKLWVLPASRMKSYRTHKVPL